MNAETITLLRELSERLGVGLDQLIDLFVDRAIADAVFTVFFCGVLAYLSCLVATRWWAMGCDYSGDEAPKELLVGLFALVALFMVGAMLNSAVVILASPRAEAIVRIMKMLPGGGS